MNPRRRCSPLPSCRLPFSLGLPWANFKVKFDQLNAVCFYFWHTVSCKSEKQKHLIILRQIKLIKISRYAKHASHISIQLQQTKVRTSFKSLIFNRDNLFIYILLIFQCFKKERIRSRESNFHRCLGGCDFSEFYNNDEGKQ